MISPYFKDDLVTIYHGDCREILPLLPHADLVFADPPYGIGKAVWDSEFPDWCIPLLLGTGSPVAITPGEDNFQRAIIALGDSYKGLMIGHFTNAMGQSRLGFKNFIPVIIGGPFNRCYGQTAFDFSINHDAKPDHPSSKPLVFMRWLISRLCNSSGGRHGELVIDPFMGSGTSLRAAKDLNIRSIGIEINEAYCETAVRRMSQEVFMFY